MHNLVRFIGILLLLGWGAASAQSRLPACPATGYFHNCVGTYTFPSGNKYVGDFKDGKFNGQGTFTFANGEKHVGEWKDGKANGQGTVTFPSGNKYVGDYKDDKRNGQGTFAQANGNKYVGEWKDDKLNGQGTYTFADGSVEKAGIWADGQFVRSAPVQEQRTFAPSQKRKSDEPIMMMINGKPVLCLQIGVILDCN
jgi:prepilin-type processing-associated H-X9-DG protein